MVLFSGFLYDTAALPQYLAWLPKVSIVNYGFSAMVSPCVVVVWRWWYHGVIHHTLIPPHPTKPAIPHHHNLNLR